MNGEDVAWEVVKAALPALPGLGKMLVDALAGGHGDEDTRAKVADLVKEKLPEKSATAQALEGFETERK